MSKKKFDKFFVANLRRTFQIVAPAVKEKQKLQAEVEAAQARIAELDAKISVLDEPIKRDTGGYGVEDLIIREVVDTGKVDKDGKPVKVTKLNLRYPETIVPPTEEQPVGGETTQPEETQEPEPERPIE